MDTLQETLGQLLLALVGFAVVLFTIILLLIEADYILRLGGKLARRRKSGGFTPDGSDSPAIDEVNAQRPRNERVAR